MKKLIVIGTSLSGKTTLIKHLRVTTNVNISEIDEELTRINNGTFPTDTGYKHNILFPKVLENILNQKSLLFFTNAWYFSVSDLREAKEKGYEVLQLNVSLEELKRRNTKRHNEEGYEDLEQYLDDMVKYQNEVKESGVVDHVIEGEQPIENIAKEILKLYK